VSETDDSYLTKTSEYESYEKSLLKKKKKKFLLVKMGSQFCEKLTPAEFQQLQDFAAYSNKTISDVLEEFEDGGCLSNYDRNKDIDLPGFQKFLDCFLEVSAPEELCRHLFQTFIHAPEKSLKKGKVLQAVRL